MKINRYYLQVIDGDTGSVIFGKSSNDPFTLVKAYKKASRSSDGNVYQAFYFGTISTNIPDELFNQLFMEA